MLNIALHDASRNLCVVWNSEQWWKSEKFLRLISGRMYWDVQTLHTNHLAVPSCASYNVRTAKLHSWLASHKLLQPCTAGSLRRTTTEPCVQPFVANRIQQAGALLEGDEAGGVGGADSGLAVLHWLVWDAVLSQVAADHVRLDLDLCIKNTTIVVHEVMRNLKTGTEQAHMEIKLNFDWYCASQSLWLPFAKGSSLQGTLALSPLIRETMGLAGIPTHLLIKPHTLPVASTCLFIITTSSRNYKSDHELFNLAQLFIRRPWQFLSFRVHNIKGLERHVGAPGWRSCRCRHRWLSRSSRARSACYAGECARRRASRLQGNKIRLGRMDGCIWQCRSTGEYEPIWSVCLLSWILNESLDPSLRGYPAVGELFLSLLWYWQLAFALIYGCISSPWPLFASHFPRSWTGCQPWCSLYMLRSRLYSRGVWL